MIPICQGLTYCSIFQRNKLNEKHLSLETWCGVHSYKCQLLPSHRGCLLASVPLCPVLKHFFLQTAAKTPFQSVNMIMSLWRFRRTLQLISILNESFKSSIIWPFLHPTAPNPSLPPKASLVPPVLTLLQLPRYCRWLYGPSPFLRMPLPCTPRPPLVSVLLTHHSQPSSSLFPPGSLCDPRA